MPLRYLPTTLRAANFPQHLRSRFVRNAPGYAKRSNVITSTLEFSPSARRLWLNKTIRSELQWNRPHSPPPQKKFLWIQSKLKTSQNPQSCGSVICSAALFYFFAQNSPVSFCNTVSKTLFSALWWCVWRFERERYINDVFKKCLKSGRSLLFNLLFQKPLLFFLFFFF